MLPAIKISSPFYLFYLANPTPLVRVQSATPPTQEKIQPSPEQILPPLWWRPSRDRLTRRKNCLRLPPV